MNLQKRKLVFEPVYDNGDFYIFIAFENMEQIPTFQEYNKNSFFI